MSTINLLDNKLPLSNVNFKFKFLKFSSTLNNLIKWGFCLQISITPVRYFAGSYKNSLIAVSLLKTQFLSLYRNTPNDGLPGINKPFFLTTDQIQNPK